MKRTHVIIMALGLLAAACSRTVTPNRQVQSQPDIFPDYADVTIPCNIAPMNFQLNGADSTDTQLLIAGDQTSFQVKGTKGDFDIPIRKWKQLLNEQRGKDITFTVCYKDGQEWVSYKPFKMHVVNDSIDPWLAYRLIPPGYGIWNAMGIYQRCLEDFTQKPIMENRLTEYNCMNCHCFQNGNPRKMSLHIRGRHGGTVICEDQNVSKITPQMPEGMKGIAYAHWHPTHDLIAYASDRVAQSFYANHRNRIEVYDTRSDVVVYDMKTGIAHTAPCMSDPGVWETFPAFSADGKSIYWMAADTVPTPYPIHYHDAHFSIVRTDFNPDNCTFGEKADTILNAGTTTSFSYPRESPNGRWMVYNKYDYGYFPLNHQEGDLYIRDMKTGESREMTEVNTDHAEGYHTWSRNSHWLVYSSRRMDGLFVRAYFTYVDDNGRCGKPFVMPQQRPKHYYDNQFNSYNIPEFITGEVKFSAHKIAQTVW
jgi:hypothetical protein